MLKNVKSTTWLNKTMLFDITMTFEKNECQRCTRICFCIVLGNVILCDHCFETLHNDPETKNLMKSIEILHGLDNIEA
jgi:hypothetical protein